MVAEQLRQMGSDTSALILEPVGRNTAPAIALAVIEATRHGGAHHAGTGCRSRDPQRCNLPPLRDRGQYAG